MFKKTYLRQILKLLNKNLSVREIARVLFVSCHFVASVKETYDKCDKNWDEIATMSDDEIYSCFYLPKFTLSKQICTGRLCLYSLKFLVWERCGNQK